MAQVLITVDVKPALRLLNDAAKKQVPFATAQAINALAFDVMRAERAAMTDVFKHPRPFTQSGTVVQQKASKGSPIAVIGLKPKVAEYLAPFEFGGLHHLPGKGLALLNPKAARLDQFGQIPGRPSNLAPPRAGATAAPPSKASAQRQAKVFVGKVTTKSGVISGFWRRLANHHLQLLVRFGDALPVKKKLHFEDRARAVVQRDFAAAFVAALNKAMTKRS